MANVNEYDYQIDSKCPYDFLFVILKIYIFYKEEHRDPEYITSLVFIDYI